MMNPLRVKYFEKLPRDVYEQNQRNLVQLYQEELRRVLGGERAIEVFSYSFRRTLLSYKILIRVYPNAPHQGSVIIIGEEGKKLLREIEKEEGKEE